jgi:hypothetical protein
MSKPSMTRALACVTTAAACLLAATAGALDGR